MQRVTAQQMDGRSTPKPGSHAGGEATVKVCGVGVAMLSGQKLGASLVDRHMVNVGTILVALPSGHPARPGAGPSSADGRGWGGGCVVLRAGESPAHGEGGQQAGGEATGMPGERR
jgi:hypothetical protein